jgi:hypothetical protein
MAQGLLFKAGNVEMWVREIDAVGVPREEYQVRSPQVGLTGAWHRNFSDADREFREQVALGQAGSDSQETSNPKRG